MRAVKTRRAGAIRSVRDVNGNGDVAGKHSDRDALDDAMLQVGLSTVGVEDKCPEDPLAVVFAQDAPLTLTARDDPCVIAHLPLRFKDVLPAVCHQLQFRQRQATHQTCVDADSFSTKDNPLTSPAPPTVDAASHPPPPYQHAHVSDMVVRLLPIAVGQARSCKTALMHPEEDEEDPTAATAAHGPESTDEQQQQQQSAASTEKRADHEAEDAVQGAPALAPVSEHQLYRTRATEQLLEYFFSSPTPADGADSVDRDEARRSFTVAACLSGMREVPSGTVEYVELLREMVSLEDSLRDAKPDETAVDAVVHLPPYVRDLLVGVSPTESTPAAASLASSGVASGVKNVALRTANGSVAAVERVPVVTTTLRSTLDAVLPPRLFLYYSVHHATAVAVHQRRQAAQRRQAHLRRHQEAHPDDVKGLEEMEALREALAGEYMEAPVGVVLVILERTSDVQAPRDYLLKLEQTLNEVLDTVRARCCGRPLKLIRTSTAHQPAPKQQRHTASAPAASGLSPGTRLKQENASSSSSSMKAASAKGQKAPATTIILATPDKQVCTRTLKPLPAQPAAMSASGGGSATVFSTLNVVELNKERTLVQLSLLGEELIRQVTVDLPERGVLLRRLLDEAQLSIDACAILARERSKATQEHLLDGQDVREATVVQCKVLESEVAELRSRLAYVTAHKAALRMWVEEQKARELAVSRERVNFETSLQERLTAHTERVKMAQDAARRSSLPG
ncbi:Axonemal dynein light chain [Leishmania braziliensis]|nr:Axonemal dynein light chain [Leishmania braziliensis]